jgi:hypothetical protein
VAYWKRIAKRRMRDGEQESQGNARLRDSGNGMGEGERESRGGTRREAGREEDQHARARAARLSHRRGVACSAQVLYDLH